MKVRNPIWFLLLLAILLGCQPRRTDQMVLSPNYTVLHYCEDLVWVQEEWVIETQRRYDKFVLVLCHGTELAGQWYATPDLSPPLPVRELVRDVRRRFPERRIVLIVCNPGGFILREPGVSFATTLVWTLPDSFVNPFANYMRDLPHNYVGDINEFKERSWEPIKVPRGGQSSKDGT